MAELTGYALTVIIQSENAYRSLLNRVKLYPQTTWVVPEMLSTPAFNHLSLDEWPITLSAERVILVLHPQEVAASQLKDPKGQSLPTIVLPRKVYVIPFSATTTQEQAQAFYHTLHQASKYHLPPDLYNQLGKDQRIFNLLRSSLAADQATLPPAPQSQRPAQEEAENSV